VLFVSVHFLPWSRSTIGDVPFSMADQQTEEQGQPAYNPLNFLKSPFPAPPPFWKHFTADNLSRLADATASDTSTKLPYDLAVLSPPPPPTAGSYPTFNQSNQVAPRADPPPPEILLFDPDSDRFNPAVMLTRLTKSLLLNFLELMTILTENPTERTEKMEDIRRLVINVHAVINMYRPHQARESVKERLLGMLEDGEKEIERAEVVKGRVAEFLSEVEVLREKSAEGDGGADVSAMNGHVDLGKVEDERQVREARELWSLVSEIAGE
jgi:mediator of RNA polymerase II transcription subunit 7